MKDFTRKINWRTVLGALILIAAAVTIFTLMIYGSRTSAARISGSVTIAAAILFLVTGGLQQLQFFRSRQFMRGSASSLYAVAIIGILVLVNVVAAQTSWRWDVTATGEHSLSEQTQTVLRELEEDVHILAFFPEGSEIGYEVEDLLREYQYLSNRIHVQFIDPEKKPGVAREYEVSSPYTTVVESGGQRRTISGYNLYDMSAGYDDPSQIMFRGEQAFTRAIIDLTQKVGASVYFMTGHGEADLYEEYSILRAYMDGEGYRPSSWNPGSDGPIPEDADLIVIAG
ncbi:MAG: GldG family protein, partial [Bacillota bacterium]